MLNKVPTCARCWGSVSDGGELSLCQHGSSAADVEELGRNTQASLSAAVAACSSKRLNSTHSTVEKHNSRFGLGLLDRLSVWSSWAQKPKHTHTHTSHHITSHHTLCYEYKMVAQAEQSTAGCTDISLIV